MRSGCLKAVTIYSNFDATTRRERFKFGFEDSIRKFYAQGYPMDILCLAMGISIEELCRIVNNEGKVSLRKY